MTRAVATVRGRPDYGEIVLTPADDGAGLRKLLSARLPDARRRRQARGIRLDALDATRMLDWSDATTVLDWDHSSLSMLRRRRQALEVHSEQRRLVSELRHEGAPLARRLLGDGHAFQALDDHQWVNVAAMTLPGGFGLCLFDEQGAGKTVCGVHAVDVLAERREVMTTLIVAPKSMVTEWKVDFERFMGSLYRVELLVGPKPKKLEVLAGAPDVVACGFETAVSMEAELRSYLRRFGGRALLVVDESFNVKNEDARRTRAIRRLREEFDRAVVLCGTPAPNAPQDVVSQFDLVDFGITFRGVEIPKDRDDALPIVRAAIEKSGVYTRHLKQDVLPNLPGKTFHRVGVELRGNQAEAYSAALKDLVLDLRSTTDEAFQRSITSFLARRAALLRICSDPGGVVPGFTDLPAKVKAIDELLADWIGRRGENVVLWSFYRGTTALLVDRYASYGAVRYDGSVAAVEDRREAVRRFQEDDDTKLFVGNAAAGGAGLTLHRARLAIYESMSNQAAHFLQSVDRIHRRGQERDVEYAVLLCEGSIEETEFDRLLGKEQRARDLLGDAVDPPVTRASLLGELLLSAERVGVKESP